MTSRPHLPRLSRRGRRWWRSRRTGYRRCGGSRCIPVVANRVLGVEGQRNGRGRALEGGLGRDARSFSRPAASGTRVAREGRPSAVRGGRRVSVGARGMRTHVRRLGLDGLQVGLQPEHGGRLLARRARHGPLGSTFGLVAHCWRSRARWDCCWLGSGCRLGFSDAWVSNAVARRRVDASEAPRKDPPGVRKRECGLGARRPAVHAGRPFLTKLFRGCDWAALARFAFGRFL